MKYPEEKNLNQRTLKAIQLFHEIAQGAKKHNWTIVFLSGFAIDAHFGYITKNHKDVDVMILKEQIKEMGLYLIDLGHELYEIDKGECLKVDHADPEKLNQTYGDIHYCWEEQGKAVIPLHGKKLVFSTSLSEIAEKRSMLGEIIPVLKPQFLIEEKRGWREQIGLAQSPERLKQYEEDMNKIKFILANTPYYNG